MLLTLTPNLCIERTLEIPDFSTGKVHRVPGEKLHLNAGGKGINAARVAARLGQRVLALSAVGKNQRHWFERQLEHEGVACELVEVEADTRVCTNILHGQNQKTEILESGAPLSIEDGTRLLDAFQKQLPRAALVAICGSYPPGRSTPGESDALELHLSILCRAARDAGKKVIVDGKGAAFEILMRSAQAQSTPAPWAIKPNTDEAAALLGFAIENQNDEFRAVEKLLAFGVEIVILSCGARGAWLATNEQKLFFTAPAITEVSAVGSGDSLVGAFAALYLQNADLIEAMRWGVAAGAANAAQKLSAFCTRAEIEVLLPHIGVQDF